MTKTILEEYFSEKEQQNITVYLNNINKHNCDIMEQISDLKNERSKNNYPKTISRQIETKVNISRHKAVNCYKNISEILSNENNIRDSGRKLEIEKFAHKSESILKDTENYSQKIRYLNSFAQQEPVSRESLAIYIISFIVAAVTIPPTILLGIATIGLCIATIFIPMLIIPCLISAAILTLAAPISILAAVPGFIFLCEKALCLIKDLTTDSKRDIDDTITELENYLNSSNQFIAEINAYLKKDSDSESDIKIQFKNSLLEHRKKLSDNVKDGSNTQNNSSYSTETKKEEEILKESDVTNKDNNGTNEKHTTSNNFTLNVKF